MPHIFISYAKRDGKPLATELHKLLENIPGVTVWMDKELTAGRSWEAQIQSEIDRCDYMVVLLTPDVNRPETDKEDRSFVLNEIMYARQKRKKIIPVLAQKTDVPAILISTEYIDFASRQQEGLERLVNTILQEAGIADTDAAKITRKLIDPVSGNPAKQTAVPSTATANPSRQNPLLLVGAAASLIVIVAALLFVRNSRETEATPTSTPNAQTLAAALLLTRQAPTPVPTLDITQAIETAMAEILATTNIAIAGTLEQEVTQTARAMPTSTFTETPDFALLTQVKSTEIQATVQFEQVQGTQIAQLTAKAPTNTLPPTFTATRLPPTETSSPTISATVTVPPDLTLTAAAQSTEGAASTQVFMAALTDVAQTTPISVTLDQTPTAGCNFVFGMDDTLYQIALDTGVDLEALVKFNPDLNPRRIGPGTIIQIPCSGKPGYNLSNQIVHNLDWTVVSQVVDGFSMVLVPTGCFSMGSFATADEQPVETQCFRKPFWIDQYEVTNQQFGSSGRFAGDDLPRENVNWVMAREFCAARGGRLPTEAEWEYAARGPDSLKYPWGDDFDGTKLNYCDKQCDQTSRDATYDDGYVYTAPVGSYPAGASWVGALDLSGNVWEWTSTLYNQENYPYPYATSDGRENQFVNQGLRVRRGGSWDYAADPTRASNRLESDPSSTAANLGVIGFRCVMDYEEPAAP